MTDLFATLQLADSFFPSGMFTQSHGLESFVAAGVAGEAQLAPLLHSYLLHVAAPSDALAARWAARAAAAHDLVLLGQIDRRLEATKLSEEGRIASRRCGGRLLTLGSDVFGGSLLPAYAQLVAASQAPGHQAIALTLLGVANGLDEQAIVAIELHSFAVSLVSAAIRLGALDHIAAQRLLLAARPVLIEAALLGAGRTWHDIGSFAPGIDLMQMRHPHAETHMFVS